MRQQTESHSLMTAKWKTNKQKAIEDRQKKERKKETVDWHILQEAGRKDVKQRRKNNSMNEGRSVTKVN